ncbi:MAG: helix-turn-helix transcriptional regulator [Oscillospiraceae bacterium]|nr:helix-turn-helix transcriptional regulator [Oscillospiraceae bacterium]
MTAEFVRDRITRLRIQKGISEYRMSYDLGHSRGYINNISSGKSLPSMVEFFAICEYLDITPIEFFDDNIENPGKLKGTFQKLQHLDADDLDLINRTVERLLRK